MAQEVSDYGSWCNWCSFRVLDCHGLEIVMSVEEASVYERCEPDDPRCCQGVNKNGPCNLKAVDGQRFCRIHFGIGNKIAEKTAMRNYQLNVYQHRVDQFADNDQVKSLREEIGILRMLLEKTINLCKSENELLLYSNKIADLAMKIEKVVASCHKLELSTGTLLDKSTVMMLGDVIIQIVGEYLPPDKIQCVSERIVKSIVEVNEPTDA
jgi:hypothetical protein